MSVEKVKKRISEDKAIIDTYIKELNFHKQASRNSSWWQLRSKLDLKPFYLEMNKSYNLYRSNANSEMIEELEAIRSSSYSLDTLIRVCHLSPYIYYEPEDFHKNYILLEHYIWNYKPGLDNLVRAYVLECDREEQIPF